MAKASDAVVVARATGNFDLRDGAVTYFRTGFTVLESVKGSLTTGSNFELQAWDRMEGDRRRMIWGDPEYTKGSVYLIFLSRREAEPYWQPVMLAYGIFEQKFVSNETVLIPSKESLEIEAMPRPDGVVPEPLEVYSAGPLINRLRAIVNGQVDWDKNTVLASNEINQSALIERVPPTHCTYLNIGGNNTRYTGFPADDIVLYSEDNGDNSFSPASAVHTQVSNAVTDLETSYTGINYNYSGTLNYTPNCVGGSAGGGNFLSVIGVRQGIVIYNDPCNEIPNLSSCAGTLALGGLYASGTHTYDGITWATGYNTYVIVNNDIGPVSTCLTANQYKIMLIHELTHGVGIGHIATGAGVANMNPSCCNTIQSLDVQCLNYTYPAALPVELIDFTARKQSHAVTLEWSTASEIDNAFFLIERSVEGGAFETIGKVQGAGNSQEVRHYHFTDKEPASGLNYYRLKQVDFGGNFENSPLRTVQFETGEAQISVYPNPLNGDLLNVSFSSPAAWDLKMELMDSNGKVLFNQNQFLEKGVNPIELPLAERAAGIYWLRLTYGGDVYVKRLVKM